MNNKQLIIIGGTIVGTFVLIWVIWKIRKRLSKPVHKKERLTSEEIQRDTMEYFISSHDGEVRNSNVTSRNSKGGGKHRGNKRKKRYLKN